MAEIDLTRLPAPKVIEELDFEAIFERKKAALIALVPESIRQEISTTLSLESEPLTIDLQQQAYQEMILRQRINQAAASTLLAFAQGSDLDHLAAARGISRKVIREQDPSAVTPIEAEYETDDDLRRRVQIYPEKLAAAGPRSAYEAHALDAKNNIIDARAIKQNAGTVAVYIKTVDNGGVADSKTISAVQLYLSDETRRPLCDTVIVYPATPKEISIVAKIKYEDGPDRSLVKAKQEKDLAGMISRHVGLGASIALSKIIGSLDTDGVKKIELTEPTQDVVCETGEFIRIVKTELREI